MRAGSARTSRTKIASVTKCVQALGSWYQGHTSSKPPIEFTLKIMLPGRTIVCCFCSTVGPCSYADAECSCMPGNRSLVVCSGLLLACTPDHQAQKVLRITWLLLSLWLFPSLCPWLSLWPHSSASARPRVHKHGIAYET